MRNISYILIAIACMSAGCKKNNNATPHKGFSMTFKGKSYSEIRSAIDGRWKVVSQSGGFAGITTYFSNAYIVFSPQDSAVWTNNKLIVGTYLVDSFPTKSGYPDSVYLLHPGYLAFGYGLSNDSMALIDVGINDGYDYCLVKQGN